MGLLARTAEASINAKQLDASIELGYDYRTGSVTITPYGKLVLRRTSLEGFTETGAGAFSLDVDGRKKTRSEEHTSELQSLMRISYAVFCLKKKKINNKLRILVTNEHSIQEYK